MATAWVKCLPLVETPTLLSALTDIEHSTRSTPLVLLVALSLPPSVPLPPAS